MKKFTAVSLIMMFLVTSTSCGEKPKDIDMVDDGSIVMQVIEGDYIITEPGTVIENMIIKGDLYISESVGDGDADIYNVDVLGDIIVNGG